MLKFIVLAIAVVSLLIGGIYFDIIPTGSLLDDGLDTVHGKYSGCIGNPGTELLDHKAYIQSYKTDGHSEKIIATGSVKHGDWSTAHAKYYRYTVYLKENAWSTYEIVSGYHDGRTETSKYISNPNPGKINTVNWKKGGGSGEIHYVPPYIFTIIGDKYADGAIKVVLDAYIDYNALNPLDKGYEWKVMSSDEAMLYSGYGGLYLPRGIVDDIDRPYDTFEIGQEVDIRVETAKGGYGVDKPWRVTLNEPYSGDIDEPGDGGGVVVEKFYANDLTNGHFKFTVTADMAKKSMESSDPYTVRIWNILLPKGSLYIDFLDFIALAPSDVEFVVTDIQAKVGEKFSIGLSAESDLGIDYFRVSVIYGTNDVLLPSDPLSKLWLMNTRNVGDSDDRVCSIPQTIGFIPEYSSYVTIHAKAFDLEGRGSVRTRTYTIWTYEDSPVPDEVVEDETGEEDYGGGQTPGYMPWDPEGGNWEDIGGELEIDWLGVMVAIFIILGFFAIGFFVGKDPKIIVLMTIGGIVVAVLVYAFFFTSIFG